MNFGEIFTEKEASPLPENNLLAMPDGSAVKTRSSGVSGLCRDPQPFAAGRRRPACLCPCVLFG